MSKNNKRRVHEFLLSEYFDSKPVYDIRSVGKWVLVKSMDGHTGQWIVSIYTQESYQKHHEFTQQTLITKKHYPEEDDLIKHFKQI